MTLVIFSRIAKRVGDVSWYWEIYSLSEFVHVRPRGQKSESSLVHEGGTESITESDPRISLAWAVDIVGPGASAGTSQNILSLAQRQSWLEFIKTEPLHGPSVGSFLR